MPDLKRLSYGLWMCEGKGREAVLAMAECGCTAYAVDGAGEFRPCATEKEIRSYRVHQQLYRQWGDGVP